MKLWYSIQNCGDGSAYPELMECEAQAILDQKYADEGWGETCVGFIEVESDSPITVKSRITTIAEQLASIEERINYKWNQSNPNLLKQLKAHRDALKQIQEAKAHGG